MAQLLKLSKNKHINFNIMNEKKNSRFDLERKRFVLLQIGLLTAGSLTLAAFTYTKTIRIEHEKQGVVANLIDIEVMQIQQKKDVVHQQKRTPQKSNEQQLTQKNGAVSDQIDVSKNTGKEITSGIVGEMGIPKGPGEMGNIIDVRPEDDVDLFPPIPTEFIGGRAAMIENINDNVHYPQIDIETDTQGKVYLTFIVEKDGSISNIEIVRGVSPSLDREAKRIVRNFPKWKPAENAYGPVRTRVQLPINFTFEKG